MDKQKEMVESFMMAHRQFTSGLKSSINMLDKEIQEAKAINKTCTDEWCTAIEGVIDDLAKSVYAIHEPRWTTKEDAKTLSNLRHKIHDLYANYRAVRA